MRDDFENEPTEETKARQDKPERTLEEQFEELISETAQTLMDDLSVAAQEEIDEFCPEDSREVADALEELEERIEELLLAAYGADFDCAEYAARATECVHAIFLPYYQARERHAGEVDEFISDMECMDHDAYNDAVMASERHARKAAQQMSLMLRAEPKSV